MTKPDDTPPLTDHEEAVVILLEVLAETLTRLDSMPHGARDTRDTRDKMGAVTLLRARWEEALKDKSPAVCRESSALRSVLDEILDQS